MTSNVFGKQKNNCLWFVLKGLVPYTEENLMLSFKPSMFFSELEKVSNNRRRSLQNAYYSARRNGYVSYDNQNQPKLTLKGKNYISPYRPKIIKNAKLLVIFDIPETENYKRRQFRYMLKELSFKQIQKSVWQSEYDHKKLLNDFIKQLKLDKNVQIYEALKIQ